MSFRKAPSLYAAGTFLAVVGLCTSFATPARACPLSGWQIMLSIPVGFFLTAGLAATTFGAAARNLRAPGRGTPAAGLALAVAWLVWAGLSSFVGTGPTAWIIALFAGLASADAALRGHLTRLGDGIEPRRRTVGLARGLALTFAMVVLALPLHPARSVRPWLDGGALDEAGGGAADSHWVEATPELLTALGVPAGLQPLDSWNRASWEEVRWTPTEAGAVAWFPSHQGAWTLLRFTAAEGAGAPLALSAYASVEADRVTDVLPRGDRLIVATRDSDLMGFEEAALEARDATLHRYARAPVRWPWGGPIASLAGDGEDVRVTDVDGRVWLVDDDLERWPGGVQQPAVVRLGLPGAILFTLAFVVLAGFAWDLRRSGRPAALLSGGTRGFVGELRTGPAEGTTLRTRSGELFAVDTVGARILGTPGSASGPSVVVGTLLRAPDGGAYRGSFPGIGAELVVMGDERTALLAAHRAWTDGWLRMITATWLVTLVVAAPALLS